jgi:hypothetical protein
MKAVLNKFARYKWIPVWFLAVESLVLLPFYLLVISFAGKYVIFDPAVTPPGSIELTQFIVEGLVSSDSNTWLVMGLIFCLPLLLLTKIALAAGNFHALEYESNAFSDWLAAAGQHSVKAIALFLRWLPLPLIWLALCLKLLSWEIDIVKYLATTMLVMGWLLLFAWLNYAMIEVVQQKKKSLRTGWQLLKASWLKVLFASVLFLVAAALINLLPLLNLYLGFSNWANLALMLAIAALGGILMRSLIFIWQIGLYANYEKWKGYR